MVEWVQRGAPQSLTLPDPLNMLTEISPLPVGIRAEVSPGPRSQAPGRSPVPKDIGRAVGYVNSSEDTPFYISRVSERLTIPEWFM